MARTSVVLQTLTVLSLLPVYKTPWLPPPLPPPHLTTFTLAVWPPSVHSDRRVSVLHIRTVPSLDEDASRGEVAFLFAANVYPIELLNGKGEEGRRD